MTRRIHVDPNQATRAVPAVPGPIQPPAWGRDSLPEYMATTHQNRLATFANKPQAYGRLAAIDECFGRINDGWTMPAKNSHLFIAALLFARAVGSYRAACEGALAGHSVEMFAMIRALLEAAAYSLRIEQNPDLAEVWLRRHDGEAALPPAQAPLSIPTLAISTVHSVVNRPN